MNRPDEIVYAQKKGKQTKARRQRAASQKPRAKLPGKGTVGENAQGSRGPFVGRIDED